MSTRRLFVGTFLTPEQQQALGSLKGHRDDLSRLWHRKLRFVNSLKLHMTWIFLGDVEEENLAAVTEALAEATTGRKRSAIVYDGIDFWPSPGKPRQLVMTSRAVPDEMVALAGEIRRSLKPFAARPDDRAFRPHITLLRFDSAPGAHARGRLSLPEDLHLERVLPLAHKIDDVSLIESHLGSGQDEYEVLKSFPL